MRLFIAILLSKDIIEKIHERELRLAHLCNIKFVPLQNLHITLNFIGETNRIQEIINIIDEICSPQCEYKIQGLGRFRRNDGDILWTGIEDKAAIEKIQRQLTQGLLSNGFKIEARTFKPHITLARRVNISDDNYYTAKHIFCTAITSYAKRISLMKSERKNNKMVYTEIYGKDLF